MSQFNTRSSATRAEARPSNGHLRLPRTLQADCTKCSGLCCAVHAFYADQGFGFDKPAHTACRHLDEHQHCAIHRERKALGFIGCIVFDCYGAGQRVTQELFPGGQWRTSMQTAASMFAAYSVMLGLHRLLAQLSLGASLTPPDAGAELAARRDQLERLCRSPAVAAGVLSTATLEQETLQFLRHHIGRGPLP